MTQTGLARQRPRRGFLPGSSLAAVRIVVTLCAIGLWYWYRVPFETVHETKGRKIVESVCRTWDGTVRHGPRRVYFGGKLGLAENYRNGVAHGSWRWFDAAGKAYLEAEFHH